MQIIDQGYLVQKGDYIQLDFDIIGIWEQTQIAAIISAINEDGRVAVNSYSIDPGGSGIFDTLHIYVTADPPFLLGILIAFIAGSIAASILLYLSFRQGTLLNRKYIDVSPTPSIGQTITSVFQNTATMVLVIGGVIVFLVLKGKV